MPVLDVERGAPRSVLRYQPNLATNQASAPPVSRRSRVRVDMSAPTMKTIPDDLDTEEGLSPSLPRRSVSSVPRRRSLFASSVRSPRRLPPLLYLGSGLITFVLLWVGVGQALVWGNNVVNGWRYGYPRTFQVDAVVGHQDSPNQPSHFLTINLHGQIQIIEWPGGDASRARVYLIEQLVGPGSDLEPVTLRFLDLTEDHLPDMVITVQNTQIVFINDQGSFRQLRPEEQQPIMQRLRQMEQAP